MHKVVLLGATGSIGDSTLDVLARHPDRFELVAVAAAHRIDKLAQIIRTYRPKLAAVADQAGRDKLRDLLPANLSIDILVGSAGLEQAARLSEADTVVSAIVGAVGLEPTLAAARAGKRILLANKEALVVGGPLLIDAARDHGGVLLPVDSEHNALFQCMPSGASGQLQAHGVRRLWLTASGGPFRQRDPESLHTVTPDQACAHPNWVMGRKISVDSATMMNKGLEVIEARWLFDCPPEAISVVIHPQSIIHSMVEYVDGSFLAHLGSPDMRTPIAHALAYPQRIEAGVARLDPFTMRDLHFEAADLKRFACLGLAFDALRSGHCACIVLNAANEIAVQAFLDGQVRYTDIPVIVERTLGEVNAQATGSLDAVLAIDQQARRSAVLVVADLTGKPVQNASAVSIGQFA